MANYPSGVYAPAAKSNGQVIQASFFNDPDSEIGAIESGLLNGLQHGLTVSTGGLTVSTGSVNISGPSSLATLQVNGGSTFGGDVTFSAGVALPSTFAVARGNTFRLSHSAAVTIADNTHSALNFDTETWDVGDGHSTAVNSSLYTFPSTGIWLIGAWVPWQDKTVGLRQVDILIDSTTVIARTKDQAPGSGNADINQAFTTMHNVLSSTETLGLRVYQSRGSTVDVSSGYALWGHRLSL